MYWSAAEVGRACISYLPPHRSNILEIPATKPLISTTTGGLWLFATDSLVLSKELVSTGISTKHRYIKTSELADWKSAK